MNKNIITILFFILLTGCTDRTPTELEFKLVERRSRDNDLIRGRAPLSFKSLQKYILKPKCMSCHGDLEAMPENDPINFASYEKMMVKRFVPLFLKGNPEKSRFFRSLLRADPKKRMPLNGKQLNDIEMKFISDWIRACAQEDEVIHIPDKCVIDDVDDDFDDDDDWGDEDEEDDWD